MNSSVPGSIPYTYCAIDRSSQEARLATIAPGLHDEHIHCSLKTVSLNDPLPEALSYVWGDPKSTSTIFLDGHEVNITNNLYIALQHLRYPDQARDIWIDALCIDQSNLEERTHQVSLMSSIYHNALEVVAWLGPDDGYAELAFETLDILSKDGSLHFNTNLEPRTSVAVFREERWEACKKVLGSPWWNRTWTVQESLLPMRLTFICGEHSLSHEILFGAVENYQAHANSACCSHFLGSTTTLLMRSMLGPVDDLRYHRKWKLHDVDFSRLLFMFSYRKSYDPRDKVYSLLALGLGNYQNLVTADYQTAVEEVYMKASFELIRRSRTFSAFDVRTTEKAHNSKLPSWATDWSIEPPYSARVCIGNRVSIMEEYSASGSTEASVRFIEPDRLVVTGRISDRIHSVFQSPTPFWGMPHEELADICNSWEEYLYLNWDTIGPQYPEMKDSLWLLSHLMVGGLVKQPLETGSGTLSSFRYATPSSCATAYLKWQDWVPNAALLTDATPVEIIDYTMSVAIMVTERKLFITEGGYVGLGSTRMEEGDVVAVFDGGRVPYILRKLDCIRPMNEEKCEEKYELVGNSFIQGWMRGEMMKGEAVEITLR